MPATCAVCLQPIVTRNDVRVSGTEVMHRSCAASGQETVGWRQKRQIAELREALTFAQECEKRQAALLRKERERVDRAVLAADRRVDNAGAERDAALSDQVRAEIARDVAIRELNIVRAELAKRTPTPEVTPPPAEDTRDATVIRFSLLDLD